MDIRFLCEGYKPSLTMISQEEYKESLPQNLRKVFFISKMTQKSGQNENLKNLLP